MRQPTRAGQEEKVSKGKAHADTAELRYCVEGKKKSCAKERQLAKLIGDIRKESRASSRT